MHLRGDVFRRMVVSGQVGMEPGAGDEAGRRLELCLPLAVRAAGSAVV